MSNSTKAETFLRLQWIGKKQARATDLMAEPILFLCSDDATVNDQRIVAKDFTRWKEEWNKSRA